MVVGADRRLQYQLSYTSKWTLLSRLMRRFHGALVEDEERVARLRELFDGVVDTFLQVDAFSEFSTGLRQHAAEFGANLEYGLEIDFTAYDPSNFFHSLRVRPRDGADARSFDELGTGQEQILALAFAYAYAQAFGSTSSGSGLLLVVEEPEAHLHPLAQKWLGRKIHELSDLGVQVILTTHSAAFVDLEAVEGLVLVRKETETSGTTVVQHDKQTLALYCSEHGAGDKAVAATIAQFYGSSATDEIVNGLFARACLLVEGPTEALALPVLLHKAGLDLLAEGVAVVPVGGVGNLARWWRFFRAYEIPTFVVLDCDSRDDRSGARKRDLATTLGMTLDQLTPDDSEALVIYERCAVMVSDFETALRALFPSYGDLEGRGRERLGPSKPLLARYVAERLDQSNEVECERDGWQVLEALARAVRVALVGAIPGSLLDDAAATPEAEEPISEVPRAPTAT